MSTGLKFEPKMIGFVCNWCCYAGADLCGVSRYQYPPYIRLIRVMCSGRVDLAFVLQAFLEGADGVFIGGCWPAECHYITEGNYDALSMTQLCKKFLEHIGVNPERLRLEWVSASEGIRFSEVITDFTEKLKKLGPLGVSEGIKENGLKFKIEAVNKLIPYIKLVERERLRIHFNTEEEYNKFFALDEVNRLFNELIVDKLKETQIVLLLQERPRSTGEISKVLGLNTSEISRYMSTLTKHGLVRYDESRKSYTVI